MYSRHNPQVLSLLRQMHRSTIRRTRNHALDDTKCIYMSELIATRGQDTHIRYRVRKKSRVYDTGSMMYALRIYLAKNKSQHLVADGIYTCRYLLHFANESTSCFAAVLCRPFSSAVDFPAASCQADIVPCCRREYS